MILSNPNVNSNNYDYDYEINFSSEFEKIVTENSRERVLEGFKRFCAMDVCDAIALLWRLDVFVRTEADYVLDVICLDQIFEPDDIELLGNELRYQYQKNHPEAAMSEDFVRDSCKEAYLSFANQYDSIEALEVYNKCVQCLHAPKKAERILRMLETDDEKLFYAAMLGLGIDSQEVHFLKDYKKMIYAVLKALYDEKVR